MDNRLGRLFTRRATTADRRFAALLDEALARSPGPPADTDTTAEEREELATARLLRAALAPDAPPPADARARVWRAVQTRIAPVAPPAPRRHDLLRRGRPLALAGLVALLLLLLPVLLTRPWGAEPVLTGPAAALLQAASAAPPPAAPEGQVLHCTNAQTHGQPGRAPWSGRREVWIDPQRRLLRVDIAGGAKTAGRPDSGAQRQTFDGATAWQYQPGVGVLRRDATTYEQLAAQFPCALGDDLTALRQTLARRVPETTVTTGDETLDGASVTVLTIRVAATDDRTARLVFDTQLLTPAPTVAGRPVRYTFDRDGRLIRKESWILGGSVVIGPNEERLSYTLAPAEQYPAAFFSADAIAQP